MSGFATPPCMLAPCRCGRDCDVRGVKRLTPLPFHCACGQIEDGGEHACPVTHARLKETLERQRATIEFVNRQVRSISPDWDATIRWLDESIALDGKPGADQVDAYILFYEDAEKKPEHYSGAGAGEAAWRRYHQAKDNWSCHLFKRIAGRRS